MTSKAETELAKAIRDALTALGLVVWREQCGKVPVKRGYMHLAPEGTPDLVGYLPGGRLLGLEIKTARGKERPAQTEWLARAKAAGCCVATVRSVEEAVAFVQAAKGRAA